MGNMIEESITNANNKSIAFPTPINSKDITEGQMKAMVDNVKDMDWVFAEDQFDSEGKQNSQWLDYCAMNAYGVKHNQEAGKYEDLRVLEMKNNEPYE